MVRRQLLGVEPNALDGDGPHEVVSDRHPRPPPSDEVAVHSRGVDERDHGRVANPTQGPPLHVENGKPLEFREIEILGGEKGLGVQGEVSLWTLCGQGRVYSRRSARRNPSQCGGGEAPHCGWKPTGPGVPVFPWEAVLGGLPQLLVSGQTSSRWLEPTSPLPFSFSRPQA